jgi:Flp pilus assembly secretin CpaC
MLIKRLIMSTVSMKAVVLALALSAAAAAPAIAGGGAANTDLRAALDQSEPLVLSAPASGVVVGNPTVAGVSIQNERLLFVTGRAYGSTNLIVVGANGQPVYRARVTVVPDEGNSVMVTKGVSTARFDCSPLCRRRPDISDSPEAFTQTNDQINARTGQATAGQ